MAELKIKVNDWRRQRLASMRNQNVNARGELRNIDIEAEHKQIIDETSKLDKLSDCSVEVPQEADNNCFESTQYASLYTPSASANAADNDAEEIAKQRPRRKFVFLEEQQVQD